MKKREALFCALGMATVVAATGCSDDDDGEGTGGASSTTSGAGGANPELHQECVDLINGHRDSVSKPAYQRWTAAEDCSNQQAADDAAAGTPNSTFGACGEEDSTSCINFTGTLESGLPGCIQMMWESGPGDANYDMLASDTYTMVACGFHTEASGDWRVMLNFM